jgi:hypothetical protein
MSQDKIFADGFLFKRRENAPDFVIGNISVKVEEAISFLKSNQKNGWVNLNVLTAKSGKTYIELDQFVPKKKEDVNDIPEPANNVKEEPGYPEDLPF